MKVSILIIQSFVLMLLIHTNRSQYVYTQIGKDLTFTKTTQQVRQSVDLGNEFRFSKQYTIWGWFRYKDGDQPSIMNILNLHNDQEISNNSAIIGPFPNPDYPDCPKTSEQIKKLPNIVDQPEVKNNPNCFPKKIDNTDIYVGKINAKKQDILYVNFDLVPSTVGTATFNITFLFQNQDKEGFTDMKITGFNDIPLLGEYWGFFAISFDYKTSQSTMYFKIFDNSFNNSQIKTFKLDYQEFLLQKNSTLTIASVENNNYFEQVAGFTGNIAYIEMSAFYTNQLNTLWSGYMNSTSFPYQGVIIDIEFDIYNKTENTLVSKGLLNENYIMEGNYESLYQVDKNKLGVRFKNNSQLNFGAIDTLNQDQLQAIMFYFKLSYHEDLPSDFTIVQRGEKSKNGYIRISLIKQSDGRSVKIEVQGDTSQQENKWISSNVFPEDQQFIFQVGIALSPSGAVRSIYVDQFGQTNNELMNDNLNFDMSPQVINLFDNYNQRSYDGYIDFNNFKILNSASSAEFYNQTQKAVEKSKFQMLDDCLFKSSYYKNNNYCFDCKSKVLSQNNLCIQYCDKNYKNPFEKECKQCKDGNCNDIEKTTWEIEKIKPSVYRLRPTRQLLGGFNQIENNYEFKFANEKDKNEIYDYKLKDIYINEEKQYIDLEVQFRDTIVDEKLQFIINEDVSDTQFDINRNQIFHNENSITKSINLNTVKEGICYVHTNKRRALKALGITAITVFFLSVFVLLIFTICCSSRILHLGALWKFLLHNWMKIQLIAFLLFIAIYMPCCIKEFLRWLYLITVSWNHALGKPINDINEDSESFNRGMEEARPPLIFYNERIEVFYLHNFGIFFIIQGFFFLLYIVLKIWDLLATQSANIFYKLFVFMEFSGLIALYLITAMQTFVFSALNWRFAVFYHSYFVMCFLITIAYIIVFVIFWLYSLSKLVSAEYAFMNPMVRDRYYYFFAGYKNQKWGRTWDHWMVLSHFIIGLMIGILVYHQVSQLIIITCVLVLLLCITLILRPWIFTLFTIVEVIQQILILAAVILFLMIAIYDWSDCLTCGKRESVTCWFIVMFFLLAIILGALGLIAQTFISFASDEKEEEDGYRSTAKYSQAYMQDNYIQQDNQGLNNAKNVYNEEVNITTNQQQFEEDINQNKMQNFMNRIQVDEDESYMTNNQSYSYVDVPMQGRAPHELAPDSEDEKYNIDGVVRALNADDSLDSDDLEDSRLELDQQRSHLKVNEQRFYDSVYKPSYENSFVTEKHDQQKLNNLISNRNIQEETVIRNRKIDRTSFNSDINTY